MTSGFTLDGRGYARELRDAVERRARKLDGPCGIATLLVGVDVPLVDRGRLVVADEQRRDPAGPVELAAAALHRVEQLSRVAPPIEN